MTIDAVISAFELQAVWCDEMQSPFTAGLMRAAAADMRQGGPVAALIGDWPGNPVADALMMRFAGALHSAALTKRDEKLAALYPDTNRDWRMDAVWPAALDFIKRDEAWVRAFLTSPPQTNETRRAIALLPGFLELARLGPLHLLEIGASAGLNQSWDRFRYETATWSFGEKGGPWIDTDWHGPAPADLDVKPIVASRAACDQNPLDVRNPEHVARLEAYIWADQFDRMTRLHAAIDLARANNIQVERSDAAAWLQRKLEGPLPEGVTVIFHSVVWQYLTRETRDAIIEAITQAAARADEGHRLAWLRYEPLRALGAEGPVEIMGTGLRLWPSATDASQTRILARGDGHARHVVLEQPA